MIPAVLSLAFFLSGAAGLVFEIVWFHRAGLVFGNGVVAAAVVLSSFMAGLAVGNGAAGRMTLRNERLLFLYAELELTVGVSGVALTYVLPRLVGVDVPLAFAFVLLLIPASAMGATLPVLVAALRSESFGRALGTLYGWNTLGAVVGAIGAETVVIGAVGVQGAAWVAAGLNVTAAAIAIVARPSTGSGRAVSATGSGRAVSATGSGRAVSETGPGRAVSNPLMVSLSNHEPPPPVSLLSCAFLAGFALLALEVIWFRFLSMFVLTTTLAMSVMLAIVLAGIAIGGLAAAAWIPHANHERFIGAIALAASLAVAASYRFFGSLTSGVQIGNWGTIAWFTGTLALPTAVASGALFTTIGAAIRERIPDDSRAAAALTLANTIGAAVGPPIAGFVLLPLLGTERSLFAIALVYIAAALLFVGRKPYPRLVACGLVLLAAVGAFSFDAMTSYLARITRPYAVDGSQIVATREGPTESIALMRQTWMGRVVYNRLVTNGFSMSGTAIPGQRYMRDFVYWPMLLHGTPLERILVICYGAGVTASAAVDVPTATSIDVVELSRDIVAMSEVIYSTDTNPLHDRRVKLHIDDGRHFLERTAERFDLITGEPPPPRTPGAVNIYTREYFQLMRDRLSDGGIATYWVPVARPNPGTDVNTIIRAFCDVFDDCSLWNATPFDLMLAGTRGGTRFDPSRFSSVREKLADVGFETPEQVGATFLGDAAYLRELTASTPPLTDDFPQRLRPDASRPSLSDPRYPDDPAVVAQYQHVLDPMRARDAFAHSAWIAAAWPAALRESTPAWFDDQRIVNRVLFEGGNPIHLVDDLDTVLTTTRLHTLPLWMLGTDAVKQRIALTGNDGTGQVEYLRGAEMLASRQYEEAASYFGLAERRGLKAPAVRPLIAYALCKAGRREVSTAIVDRLAPRNDDEGRFLSWMKKRCG